MSYFKILKDLYGDNGATDATDSSCLLTNRTNRSYTDEKKHESEMAKLKTIEDAIMYFNNNGDLTTIKIIHCIPRLMDGCSPYDFIIVHGPLDKLSQHFATVSPRSIVEFLPDKTCNSSNSISWILDSSRYKMVSVIPSFKLFTTRKSFQQMRLLQRKRKFHTAASILSDRIVTLRSPFKDRYQSALSLVFPILSANFSIIGDADSLTAPMYIEDWFKAQTAKTCKMREAMVSIKSLVLAEFKGLDLTINVPTKAVATTRLERKLQQLRDNKKSNSVSQLKQLQKDRARLKAEATTNKLLIANFQMLIQFILTNTIDETLMNACSKYKSAFCDNRLPLIQLKVILANSGNEYSNATCLGLHMSYESIADTFQKLYNNMLVCAYESLASLTLQLDIETERREQTALCKIVSQIEVDFKSIDLSRFNPLLEANQFLATSSAKEISLQQIKDIHAHLQLSSRTKDRDTSGIFGLDASELKSTLLNQLRQYQETLRLQLLEKVRTDVRACLVNIQQQNRSNSNNDPDGDVLQSPIDQAELTQITSVKEDADQVYKAIGSMGLKVPNDDVFNLSFLSSKVDEYKTAKSH